ncbi:MAG TPA: tRNA-dihydrouridine synthase family protein [Trueperaceae bacterium]|nr:tRNA-dihydrouridine synthase family protein [Trueperaceae bacterium]
MSEQNFYTRKLKLKQAILAPMAGYTDAPFRYLAKSYGSAWAVTEMISAKALVSGNLQGIEIAAPYQNEKDLVIQIYGREPDLIAEAGQILSEKFAPSAFDINMGCPVKKILAKGMGSSLMQEPQLAAQIINKLANTVNIPISVKMRLAYKDKTASELIQKLEVAGASLIAIHARTAEQKYTGQADWQEILGLAKIVKIPIVGSGDISTQEQFEHYSQQGLGVMIARASLGKPWIFASLRGKPEPSKDEIAKICYKHAVLHCTWYQNIGLNQKQAMQKFRSKLLAYLSFLKDKSQLRQIDSLIGLEEFLDKNFKLDLNHSKINTEVMKRDL